jgi:hypothetical protein
MRLVISLVLFLTGGAMGCRPTADQLARRAAFDLKCERAKLRYVLLDDRTVGVDGCGKRATYVEVCPTGNECTWIMNNGSAVD